MPRCRKKLHQLDVQGRVLGCREDHKIIIDHILLRMLQSVKVDTERCAAHCIGADLQEELVDKDGIRCCFGKPCRKGVGSFFRCFPYCRILGLRSNNVVRCDSISTLPLWASVNSLASFLVIDSISVLPCGILPSLLPIHWHQLVLAAPLWKVTYRTYTTLETVPLCRYRG